MKNYSKLKTNNTFPKAIIIIITNVSKAEYTIDETWAAGAWHLVGGKRGQSKKLSGLYFFALKRHSGVREPGSAEASHQKRKRKTILLLNV